MQVRLSPGLVVVILLFVAGCRSDSTDGTPPFLPGMPPGWVKAGTGTGWEVGLNASQPHAGKAAAYMRSIAATPTGFVGITQGVRADSYRGKRVAWSGWVRQTDVQGGGGGLWLRVDGPGVELAFDNMDGRQLLGTAGWHRVSVVLDVPGNALGLVFGALLSGPGTLLVDDLSLGVVGLDVPSTDMLGGAKPVGGDSASLAASWAAYPATPWNLNFEGGAVVDRVSAQPMPFRAGDGASGRALLTGPGR